MRVISVLSDTRIKALNVQIELSASEYIRIAKGILGNNEYQRKKIKNAGTIYSLLKADIVQGCLMPPIVLASRFEPVPSTDKIDEGFISEQVFPNVSALLILDGLQRTHSLIEVFDDPANASMLETYKVRLEIYLNITEVGILYRMLTLNAGQTPMSLRHQIEILYSNYSGSSIGEVNILRQIDESSRMSHKDYNYSDLIEGYNSYLERNESPIDRYSLLDIVQSIGRISGDHADSNSFTQFVLTHYSFIDHLQNLTSNWCYPKESDDVPPELVIQGRPFGSTPFHIFNRTQALTGFGAAVGSLVDQMIIDSVDSIKNITLEIRFEDYNRDFLLINKCLDEVKQDAKKIGNAQRLFFRYFFRVLFDRSDSDHYLRFGDSSLLAKKRTLANM